MPAYYLQIVTENGTPITSPARPLKHRNGTLDLPLIERCEEEILKQVGLLRFQGNLRTAIRQGMQIAIQSLKEEYVPLAARD